MTSLKRKVAVSLNASNIAELETQLANYQQHIQTINFVEWRIDYLESAALISDFTNLIKKRIKVPLILTIRTQHDGGCFINDSLSYQALYDKIIALGVGHIIDIEYQLLPYLSKKWLQQLQVKKLQICVSLHLPDNYYPQAKLDQYLCQLNQVKQAQSIKLAVGASTCSTTVNLLAAVQTFTRTYNKPVIAMCLGQYGTASRTIGYQYGIALTYAYLEKPSAAGQLPIDKINLY